MKKLEQINNTLLRNYIAETAYDFTLYSEVYNEKLELTTIVYMEFNPSDTIPSLTTLIEKNGVIFNKDMAPIACLVNDSILFFNN